MSIDITDQEFLLFQDLVQKLLGIYLQETKKVLIISRLSKQITNLGLYSFTDYLNYIKENANGQKELITLVNKITTNETYFFREQHHFDFLKNEIFAKLEAKKRHTIRIWSAGCSSGEEPYSIAMTIFDSFNSISNLDIKILATDVNTEVLKKAELGTYKLDNFQRGIDTFHVNKYFDKKDEETFQIKPHVKQLITFKHLNFLSDRYPIKSELDIIFCRNVMIYFSDDVKKQIINRFCELLKPNGYLIVGHSESLISFTDKFKFLNNTIYVKKDE